MVKKAKKGFTKNYNMEKKNKFRPNFGLVISRDFNHETRRDELISSRLVSPKFEMVSSRNQP